MVDVRTLFQQIALVERISLAMAPLPRGELSPPRQLAAVRRDGTLLLVGAGIALAIFVIGGAAWLIAPDALFLWFHEAYFANDFWQLDPRTDHLIQMVPFPFWEAAITIVIGRAVAVTALTAAAGRCPGLGRWQAEMRDRER